MIRADTDRAEADPAGARRRGRGPVTARREHGTDIPRSIRRSYHPSQEGSLLTAVEYLAAPPAARTATGAVGRAAMS